MRVESGGSALAVVLLVGCGAVTPPVAWLGRSPDGEHHVSVIEDVEGQHLIVDERELGVWQAIGLTHLAWSERGVVVPVRSADGWHVWQAGALGPVHEAVGELHVREHDVVYAALDDRGWRVVVNGEVGRAYESLGGGTILVEHGHVAYVARDAGRAYAVVDGARGPAFRHVDRLHFAGKGERALYVGYEGEGARIVVDHEPGDLLDEVLELVAAPLEPRWAALVERGGRARLVHDGREVEVLRGARALRMSGDGEHLAWVTPREGGVRVWRDGRRGRDHLEVSELAFVPTTDALVYVAHASDGARAVHGERVGPRFDAIELVTSAAGHWGYVGHRQAGSAVVRDGELLFRGEWCGGLSLAASGEGWAFVTRRGGRRHVLTPRGRTEVPRPMVDTLELDGRGSHWALAVADSERRRLRILVDGEDVAALSVDELAAQVALGRDGAEAARALVRVELVRAAR